MLASSHTLCTHMFATDHDHVGAEFVHILVVALLQEFQHICFLRHHIPGHGAHTSLWHIESTWYTAGFHSQICTQLFYDTEVSKQVKETVLISYGRHLESRSHLQNKCLCHFTIPQDLFQNFLIVLQFHFFSTRKFLPTTVCNFFATI